MVDNPKLTPSTKQTLILELESDFSWTRPVSTVGRKARSGQEVVMMPDSVRRR